MEEQENITNSVFTYLPLRFCLLYLHLVPCKQTVMVSSLQLHTEVEKPLLTFRGDNFKKDLKKYDHHIADLRKQLASRYAGVEKVLSLSRLR